RWSRYELLAIDEVGYVPMADVGAEFLFQVIAERAEKAAVVLTTNLPFSEWTQVIPNARLCKALIDRITDRAHIIETGTESYRFRRTMEKQKRREATRPAYAAAFTAPKPLRPSGSAGLRFGRRPSRRKRSDEGAKINFRKGPKELAKGRRRCMPSSAGSPATMNRRCNSRSTRRSTSRLS